MSNQSNPLAGYANPPAQHRFKKGKSGNPRGRPRKQDDLSTMEGIATPQGELLRLAQQKALE